MKKLLLTTIFLLFIVGNSSAITNVPASQEWEPAGFGGSGTFPMIISDNTTPDRFYMTSDVAGNFMTKNAGDQWEYMNLGTTTIINAAIAQSASNYNVMYSIGKKLIKSTDRGFSWTTLGTYEAHRPENYKVIAINRSDDRIFYFANRTGRIYRSLDGGNSITLYATPFGANIPVEFLYINPAGTRLVAGSNGYGMVSYNLTTDVATDIDFVGTNALYNNDFGTYDNSGTEVFCVTAGLKISCTSDFSSWTNTSDVTATTTYYIRRFAVSKTGSTIRFVAWGRLLSSEYANFTKQSSDAGSTWTDVSVNITNDLVNNPTEEWASFGAIGTVFSIASDPHNASQFFIATDWRIFRSTDGGLNWVEKVKGAQNQVISQVSCSPRMSSGITRCFAAGMDIGLLMSDDVGKTWNATFPNTASGSQQGFSVAGYVWTVETRGTAEEWDAGTGQVVATTAYWVDFIPRVIISNDNGETWTVVTSGLPTTQLYVAPWSSSTSYSAGTKVRTSDGVYNCILSNTNQNPANGASPTYWELVRSISSKHAAAWGIGYGRALAKCPANDDILALGIDGYSATENGGIFISTNGGSSWTRTTQPDQWKTYNGIAFDPTDATCNTIEFGEFFYTNPELPKTWRTTNRGTTWTSVANDIGIYDLKYGSNGIAYKVGLYSTPIIDRSTNGVNWSTMKTINNTGQIANGLWIDANNPNRIAVGVDDGTNTGVSQGSGQTDGDGSGGGSIYMTADAQNGTSSNWYNITGNLPSPAGITTITAVYNYDGHDWLLIGTDGAGTWRLKLDDSLRTTVSNVRFQ